MDLILDNFAQTVKPFLLRADTRMLAEAEILQPLQVPANVIRQEPPGCQKEVRSQPGPAFSQIPLRRRQLVVVQRREQAPVVVEHRGHPQHLHRGCVKQHAEVAVMPVDVQNQGVQDAHPAEGVLTADPGEKVQELRDGPQERFSQMWYDLYKKPYLRENSLNSIKYVLNQHILPYIGGYRLRDITPM